MAQPTRKLNNRIYAIASFFALAAAFVFVHDMLASTNRDGLARKTLLAHTAEASVQRPGDVTADQIAAAYSGDRSAADRKYKRRLVSIAGQVDSVESGVDDEGCVRLTVSGESPLACYFQPVDHARILALQSGDPVRISGVCGGELANGVIIRDCRLL